MKSKRQPALDLDTIMPLLINMWRRFHKLSGPPDRLQTREFRRVIECIKMLQAQENAEKKPTDKDYFADRDLLGAYLLYQWVVHYQEAISLIGELPQSPKRALDICSGPGSFAFAALRHGASEVFAIDRNLTALELAATVVGRYGMPLGIRRWIGVDQALPVDGNFDLITLGHCLNELFPSNVPGWEKRQAHFIDQLLMRLTPQGCLLLAESSFAEDNRRLLQLRDQLVGKGLAIQAPCVWKGECPALKSGGQLCYAQRDMEKPYLLKEVQRAVGINLSSLKMSYLIVRSPQASWPQLAEQRLYRVISPPVEGHRGKRFYLCGVDGKKSLGSHLDEVPSSARAFDYLKRGELIEIENGLEQPSTLDIVEGTAVTLKAACGKPIDEVFTSYE